MIPAHLIEQFSKKVDYLISAIVEELENKPPSEKEKHQHVSYAIESLEGKTTVYWKGTLIFEAVLNEDAEGAIQGYFNLPEKFAENQYIQNTINKWN